GGWPPLSYSSLVEMLAWFLFGATVPIFLVFGCGKKKSEYEEDEDEAKKKAPPSSGNNQQPPSSGGAPKLPPQAPPPAASAKPTDVAIKAGENKIADAYDPNYQTLAAVGGGDAFGAAKAAPAPAAAPAAAGKNLPKAGENKIADATDPNYQTLAAVGGGNAFGADKAAAPAAAEKPAAAAAAGKNLPKAGENKIADAHDPNYQTLAAVGGGNAFGADK
ncbi:hypothetical protein PFISCL1PPCAC_16038, partial [Pristionchus fissidentatus]